MAGLPQRRGASPPRAHPRGLDRDERSGAVCAARERVTIRTGAPRGLIVGRTRPSAIHAMSPIQHPINGPAVLFDVGEELDIVHEELVKSSRTARTLVKNGSLRSTLIGLAAGGELATHSADGPITVF